MFAIEITNDTRNAIEERFDQDVATGRFDLALYINHSKKWYMVSGYITRAGKVIDWCIFPENMFRTLFDYETETFDVHWTQIYFDERF